MSRRPRTLAPVGGPTGCRRATPRHVRSKNEVCPAIHTTTNSMTEPERLEGVPGRYWHSLEDGDQVVIGSGQFGNVHLSPDAEAYFERKGCEVVLKPTPQAILTFNRSSAKRIGLFHVTC